MDQPSEADADNRQPDDGVETAKICRLCLSASAPLEALANDDSGQSKVQKIFELTGFQIEIPPGVPSYLCAMCESRLEVMQNKAKSESEFAQDHVGHAEQTVGTELSTKTEATPPDGAKDLHFNPKCNGVHESGKTYECCGYFPDDLFEAEEYQYPVKLEPEEYDEYDDYDEYDE